MISGGHINTSPSVMGSLPQQTGTHPMMNGNSSWLISANLQRWFIQSQGGTQNVSACSSTGAGEHFILFFQDRSLKHWMGDKSTKWSYQRQRETDSDKCGFVALIVRCCLAISPRHGNDLWPIWRLPDVRGPSRASERTSSMEMCRSLTWAVSVGKTERFQGYGKEGRRERRRACRKKNGWRGERSKRRRD